MLTTNEKIVHEANIKTLSDEMKTETSQETKNKRTLVEGRFGWGRAVTGAAGATAVIVLLLHAYTEKQEGVWGKLPFP